MSKVICNKADESVVCKACPHGKPHEREKRGEYYCTEWAGCYWSSSHKVSVMCVKIKDDNPQGGEEE